MSPATILNKNNSGFTLLETMIAMTIMVVAFTAIFAVESSSINATTRAKIMNTVATLAHNRMIKLEYEFEGKTFDEFKKEDSGTFDDPYQDYTWGYKVNEIKFPTLNFSAGGDSSGKSGGNAADDAMATQLMEMMTKLIAQHLSKAMREVALTIYWKKGGAEQSFSVSTYWVDLNHEFQLSE